MAPFEFNCLGFLQKKDTLFDLQVFGRGQKEGGQKEQSKQLANLGEV